MTGRGDSKGDQLTGGKSGILGLRRDSESDDKLNCDLFSLATVRSHRGGRLQADNNSGNKEGGAKGRNDKEGTRWWFVF